VDGGLHCVRCTITNGGSPLSGVPGLYVDLTGTAFIEDSRLASPTALQVADGRASVARSILAGPGVGLLLRRGSVVLEGGTLDGRFDVAGGELGLRGVTQTAGSSDNVVASNGHVQVAELALPSVRTPSAIRRTKLETFSNATITGSSAAALVCASAADAWCGPDASVASSSCTPVREAVAAGQAGPAIRCRLPVDHVCTRCFRSEGSTRWVVGHKLLLRSG
jgi:hypothetical protein